MSADCSVACLRKSAHRGVELHKYLIRKFEYNFTTPRFSILTVRQDTKGQTLPLIAKALLERSNLSLGKGFYSAGASSHES